eukprot:TRINITY_DN37234_c0_g1_i1.p1 TRINITY_DN37234_c0_g1~~TRINITY_DN37234_c0_g1_i1.p1  ORF type:complete len:823 (-),score=99.61 TRINITY_DN37234_c0_g1_i1:65-2533(-)
MCLRTLIYIFLLYGALAESETCKLDAQWSGNGEIVAIISAGNTLTASCSSVDCSWIWATGVFENGALSLHLNTGQAIAGQVASDCLTITLADGRKWLNLNAQIRTVHVVFMAHLDVGYTEASVSHLINDYASKWIPAALNTSAQLRKRGGPEQFAWTSHPWLIAALLQNQTGNITSAFIDDLVAAIDRDDIVWHANPMNMQAEAGDRFNMEYGLTIAAELDQRFRKSKEIAASQKDEPGVTLGMVKMFADAGVKLLHIGVNDFSTTPAFPTNSAFYHSYCNAGVWQDADVGPEVAELMLLYCSGYSGPFEAHTEAPNMMTILPGHDEALVYLMHVDNSGPQTADQVIEGWKNTQALFPSADVKLSSMDKWVDGVLRARKSLPAEALPIVRGKEMGSTWIYGVASEPRKMRWYRAVSRVVADAVKARSVNTSDPRFREFQRLLLKVPEHTDGPSGGCTGNYTNAQFHDPSYECHVGSDQYKAYVKGILDQYDFIPRAVEALGSLQPLRSDCEKAMDDGRPQAPSTAGLATFDHTRSLTLRNGITVSFNQSGALTSLLSKSGQKTYASPENPLGLFQYATHSEDELNDFGSRYALEKCAVECGMCSFSKCNLHLADARSAHYTANIESALADEGAGRFVFNLSIPGQQLRNMYGPPPLITLEVTVRFGMNADSMDELTVDYTLQWFGKPPTRMAESLWMTFNPAGAGREGWEMDKLGRWIDPLNVVANGSQTMHGIWSGVRHSQAGVFIESLDAPIVMPGNSLAPTGVFNRGDDGLPHPERGWSFNLYNNAWSTNYAFFNIDADEKFRFKVHFRSGNALLDVYV